MPARAKFEIKDAQHLKGVVQGRGYDPITRQRVSVRDVFNAAKALPISEQAEMVINAYGHEAVDFMSTTNMQPLMPQTIVQIMKEAQEPLLMATSLLDRVAHTVGQRIVFPAIGSIAAADDIGEGEPYLEAQFTIGGATMTAEIGKVGVAFKFSEEVLRYSNWDLMGIMTRLVGQDLARHKERKIFNMIQSMGFITHDNLNPAASYYGTTQGRDLAGAANGSCMVDDLFDAYTQIVLQGFIPNTILLHPLSFMMWLRDPILRTFAMYSGGGPWFATYSGNASGRAPWESGFGVATGQNIVPGGTGSSLTPTETADYPQTIDSRPNIPSLFPYPLRVLVSPFMPFDPGAKTTDIYMFDSSRLGALIVDEELTTDEWTDPETDILKVKMKERYGLGIYEEGMQIAVMRNVSTKANEIVLPAQSQISLSGTVATLDRFSAVTL